MPEVLAAAEALTHAAEPQLAWMFLARISSIARRAPTPVPATPSRALMVLREEEEPTNGFREAFSKAAQGNHRRGGKATT